MKDLGAGAQRFTEVFGADGNDHEFLKVYVVVSVRAAVDDVHHRHRERLCGFAAEITIEWKVLGVCRSARRRQRRSQNRVSAQL